ncbi:hypothetical protein Vafri_2725, partial [Volvox africanus]
MYETACEHLQHQSRFDGDVPSAVPVVAGAAAIGLTSTAAARGLEAQPSCFRQRFAAVVTPDGSYLKQSEGWKGAPGGEASQYPPAQTTFVAAVPIMSLAGRVTTVPPHSPSTMVRTAENNITRAVAEMAARKHWPRREWNDRELGRSMAAGTTVMSSVSGPSFIFLVALLCLMCSCQIKSVSVAGQVPPATPGGVPSLSEAAAVPYGPAAVDVPASLSVDQQRHQRYQLGQHEDPSSSSSSPSSSSSSSPSSDSTASSDATSHLPSASSEDGYKGSSRNNSSQDERLRPKQDRQGSSSRRSGLQANEGQPRDPAAPATPDLRVRPPSALQNSSAPSVPTTPQSPPPPPRSPRPQLHHCLAT